MEAGNGSCPEVVGCDGVLEEWMFIEESSYQGEFIQNIQSYQNLNAYVFFISALMFSSQF